MEARGTVGGVSFLWTSEILLSFFWKTDSDIGCEVQCADFVCMLRYSIVRGK